MRRLPAAMAVLLAAGTLAACSGGEDGASSPDPEPSATPAAAAADAAALEGTTFESTSVEGYELVEGTSIQLEFVEDSMSATAGCNTMFGGYELSEGTLAWVRAPASTMMACEPDLAAQDEWVTQLLTAGVTATSDGSNLTLSDGEVTVELASAAGQDLSAVLGRSWTAVATIADGATTRIPRGDSRPTLGVAADGLSRLFTGCNSGRTRVRVLGETLAFANTRVSRGTCAGSARLTEQTVLSVLDGPADHVELHEEFFIVIKDDLGLMFQLR